MTKVAINGFGRIGRLVFGGFLTERIWILSPSTIQAARKQLLIF